MDKDDAREKIDEQLKKADAALAEAKRLADENDVGFYWSGPTYGMGGSYMPQPTVEEAFQGSNDCYDDYSDPPGWQASSHSC